MNERIKELAEQAGAEFIPAHPHFGIGWIRDEWNYSNLSIEKFAELIIKKCIDLSIDTPLDSYGTPKTPESYIREYFKIEQ